MQRTPLGERTTTELQLAGKDQAFLGPERAKNAKKTP